MTRAALEYIIGAAGTIADVGDLVVIGSQAVLGEFPDAPAELLVAHGVDETTAILPDGWRDRLILVTGEGTCSKTGSRRHRSIPRFGPC